MRASDTDLSVPRVMKFVFQGIFWPRKSINFINLLASRNLIKTGKLSLFKTPALHYF